MIGDRDKTLYAKAQPSLGQTPNPQQLTPAAYAEQILSQPVDALDSATNQALDLGVMPDAQNPLLNVFTQTATVFCLILPPVICFIPVGLEQLPSTASMTRTSHAISNVGYAPNSQEHFAVGNPSVGSLQPLTRLAMPL